MKKHLKYIIAFLILEIAVVSVAVWKTQASLATPTTTDSSVQQKSSASESKKEETTLAESTQSSQVEESSEKEPPKEVEAVNENSIALTFDDGPKRETTSQLLDILAQRNIKASFFILGQNISGNEDLLKRMKDEGHVIGSHSMYHYNLSQMDMTALKKDFNDMDDKIKTVFKEPFHYIRPPYGAANKQVAEVAKRPLVQWSVDSKDWSSKNTQSIINQVTQNTTPGAIILMHDIYAETINAVPAIIDNLTQQGYNFVTVDALLNHPTENLNYYSMNDNRPAN